MAETETTTETPAAPVAPVAPAAPAATETAPAKTYTQDELDAVVAEKANKVRQQFRDYADLKAQAAQVPELASQIQTLNTEKTELQQNFSLAARDAQILKVALDKGVPSDLADRLKGNTPEEIAADADLLVSRLGKRNTSSTGFDGGVAPGSTPQAPEAADALIRRAAGYG